MILQRIHSISYGLRRPSHIFRLCHNAYIVCPLPKPDPTRGSVREERFTDKISLPFDPLWSSVIGMHHNAYWYAVLVVAPASIGDIGRRLTILDDLINWVCWGD